MSDKPWGSPWERFVRLGMKPIDRFDHDYLLVWILIVSFTLFASTMFLLWWRSA